MPILSSFLNLKNVFTKIKGQLEKKNESVVGIDLGSSSIKAVQLRREKEKAILENYGELSLSHYGGTVMGQAVRLTDEKIIEAISDLKKEAKIKAEKAIISIPLRYSFVTTISLPFMSEAEIEKAIPFEIKRYVPAPLSEIVFDWQILSSPETNYSNGDTDSEKVKNVNVLVVAIYKDFVEKYKSIIKASGFEVGGFEIEVFSMARSVLFKESKPVLLIDLGVSKTKMAIMKNGILYGAYDFDKGFQDLTLSLSRSLSVDFSRAENMKREIGFSNRPEHQEIKAMLEPILNYIFSEASRLISEHRRRENESINRVYLCGGGALLHGIIDFAINRLGVEVLMGNSFLKVEYPAFLEEVLRNISPVFVNATGLALRNI